MALVEVGHNHSMVIQMRRVHFFFELNSERNEMFQKVSDSRTDMIDDRRIKVEFVEHGRCPKFLEVL